MMLPITRPLTMITVLLITRRIKSLLQAVFRALMNMPTRIITNMTRIMSFPTSRYDRPPTTVLAVMMLPNAIITAVTDTHAIWVMMTWTIITAVR